MNLAPPPIWVNLTRMPDGGGGTVEKINISNTGRFEYIHTLLAIANGIYVLAYIRANVKDLEHTSKAEMTKPINTSGRHENRHLRYSNASVTKTTQCCFE